MVLSDRFGGKPRPSNVKRTLIYVAAFGIGSLLVSLLLGFTATSIAETVLPSAKSSRAKKRSSKANKGPRGRLKGVTGKRGSKASEDRANEGSINP